VPSAASASTKNRRSRNSALEKAWMCPASRTIQSPLGSCAKSWRIDPGSVLGDSGVEMSLQDQAPGFPLTPLETRRALIPNL
jgi:hypothetical protein